MNPKYHLLVAVAAFSLGACSTDDTVTDPEPEKGGYKFSFTVAEDSETRTTLSEKDILKWTPDDQVGIYTVGQNTNTNTLTVADVNQSPVEFIGVLENLVSQGDMFYAYYPYDAEQSPNPARATLTIPEEQTQSAAGVYNGQTQPLVAVPMEFTWEQDSHAGRINSVRFRLLGAIAELKIFSSDEMFHSEKIRSVKFVSENPLAGDFTFDLTSVTKGGELPLSGYELTEVTTTLEESADILATKEEAALVYLTIAPGTYTGKFVVTTNIAHYTFPLAQAMTFKRAVIKGLPADLARAKRKIIDPDAPIPFADEEVKRICIENWDTSGDGDLSYNEAAAVTSIGTRFSNTSISSFNELRYFTGLQSIEELAFDGCRNLTSIKIPDGVISIGDLAFRFCGELASITIPDGVTSIGWAAFMLCAKLPSINIPQTVTSIGGSAFMGCFSLSAFYGKFASEDHRYLIQDDTFLALAPAGLTTYKIPDGVTAIGEGAFQMCASLTSITIPNTVTAIGNAAFGDCQSLPSIDIPEGVTAIGYSAFANCESLTSIEIPDGVTVIEPFAFSDCSSLTSIEIPDKVTSIGEKAFRYCSALTSITIPNTVTAIGNAAFESCGGLESITIPDGVTAIERWTFSRCSSLQEIHFPTRLTSIGDSAFEYCRKLTGITIPNTVTSIGSYAFQGCIGLESIQLPEGLNKIEYSIFNGCSNLTSITIPNTVTSIGNNAFNECSGLTSITIPDGVTDIWDGAFKGCSGLTSVTIPDKVNRIGNDAFANCSSLKSVYCKPTNPPILGSRVFLNTSSSIKIYVPKDSFQAYREAYNWKDYKYKIFADNSSTGE